MTDPIADLLTRIRNANMVKQSSVDVPSSNIKRKLVEILESEGYISGYEYIDDNKQGTLRIKLKYSLEKERVITGLKRISKPGLRVYAQKTDIPRVLGGLGVAIISSSSGIITDKQARNMGVGGEVICYVW